MGLTRAEDDDEAVLRAEDEAIREAEQGEQVVAAIPTGTDLARLIESLTDGNPPPLQQG